MYKIFFFLLSFLVFAAVNCGPAVPADPLHPAPETEGSGDQVAEDEVQQIATDEHVPYDAPPHVFTPRSHTPRPRRAAPSPPNLNRLPKFKMNIAKCFGPEKQMRPVPIAASKSMGMSSKRPTRSRGKRKAGKISKKADLGSGYGVPARAEESAAAPEAPAALSPSSKEAPKGASSREIATDDLAPQADGEIAESPRGYEDWGASIYLSNDDTMSLSSAQRVIYAIDKFLPLPLEHIRPHELLNYFAFSTAQVDADRNFSVKGEIAPDKREEGIYSLALAVKGRPVTKSTRRNTALTLVIDRSGSMGAEGRMSYLKKGLKRMLTELKTGDMVHLVLFDHEVCVPAQNFVVNRDPISKLEKVIDALKPRGSTDLHRGLSRGYEIADKTYQSKYSNRVVMITDALANTGVTDQQMISMISKYYDKRKIRLSGVGVGRNFNDSLLDRLTERGKGAYVFLGSDAEVDAVFGSRFISLIETTALDVHFRLHLPPSLRMNVFYGEESSTVKTDVQEVHYFANTSQLFLSDLMARGGTLRPQDSAMLTIEYTDPESAQQLVEEYAFNLGEIATETRNVAKARVIMAWIDMLAQMAARPSPHNHRYNAGGWEDGEGWHRCAEGRKELTRLAAPVKRDREIKRVLGLWEKYCDRYERPRNPVKRQIVGMEESWPSAESTDDR